MQEYHKFFVQRNIYCEGYELLGVKCDGDNRRYLTYGYSKVNPQLSPDSESKLFLSDEDAQKLIDALWNSGVRPSNIVQERSSLESTKYHLEDMRRLVFDEKANSNN